MMLRNRIALPVLLLLASAPLAAQTPTLEQRVARLEQQVHELRGLHGLDSVPAPTAETAMPAELRGNANLLWGFPGGRGTILVKQHFVILHDDQRKLPVWVTYRLTRGDLQGTQTRTEDFRPDPALPAGHRSELADYAHSGYDRGHMAPAGDFTRSQAAMSETFLLSNMAPQRPRLNRVIWEHLEGQVRSLVRDRCDIWIFTGALYLDSLARPVQPTPFIGPDSVAVPTHFYKVILCQHADGVRETFAFVLPNSLDPIRGEPRDYLVTVDSVQRLSGLEFFAGLPKDERSRLLALLDTAWPNQ
jgi:endonuclease G